MLLVLGGVLIIADIIFFTIWGTLTSLADLVLPIGLAFFVIVLIITIAIVKKEQKEASEEAYRQYDSQHPNILRTITPKEAENKKHFRDYNIEMASFLTRNGNIWYYIATKNGKPYYIAQDLMVLKGKIIVGENLTDEKKALAEMVKRISKEKQQDIVENKLKYYVSSCQHSRHNGRNHYHAAGKWTTNGVEDYIYIALTKEMLLETIIVNEGKWENSQLIIENEEKCYRIPIYPWA